ncbi:MAG: phenylalanine--tRNA ligase subunit alpha [Dehalococcoidia bacterium]|nr:phenylalanine--tRNA ligase subunit alpha [Dehalococcoidia bacterium]|tara:strand:+ start:2463 stop:3491 length:1029 start_codon:yes stop_codon:yes gene_type:complete
MKKVFRYLENRLLDEIKKIQKQSEIDLKSCDSELKIDAWRVKYLGRKSRLSLILKDIKNLDPAMRKSVGLSGNRIRNKCQIMLEKALNDLKLEENDQISIEDYTLPGRFNQVGKLHPVTQTLREIKKTFVSLGFQIAEGPEIEWDKYNFDMLNIPDNHPARDMWDTMWIDEEKNSSGNKMLLRTHTSPVQARIMENQDPPIRVIVPGKCYRYESTDSTHEWHFYQVEGLAVDRKLTFSDLKGTLYEFVKKIFGSDTKIRFRCDYFPFVEPGVDMSIYWEGKWLEILGAGMVHPKVFEKAGYKDPELTGFAFGMGPERIAMIKHNIDDIRLFYSNDLRFLGQF